MNSKQIQGEVERHRGELADTLERLRDNLVPSHLAGEALSGGRWLPHYWRFARESRLSWAVMTVAAIGIGFQSARRGR